MPYRISPTSVGLMKDCPRCFWLHYNKNIKRPEGMFSSLPSGMDRILKTHFDKYREQGMLPPELRAEKLTEKLFANKTLLETWRNNRQGIRWTDEKENVFVGAVDEILEKDGRLIVLDYKTRGYPVKETTPDFYHDQLNIYTWLLRKNGHITEEYGYLLFYVPNTVQDNGEIKFNTVLVKMPINVVQAEQVCQKALTILQGPLPTAREECEFCAWVDAKNKSLE